MLTPGRFLLVLLALASLSANLALAASGWGSSSPLVAGCLLGLLLGELGLLSTAWLTLPARWPVWGVASGMIILTGSLLLERVQEAPWHQWAVLLTLFTLLCLLLPTLYRTGQGEVCLQFSLGAILGLTTLVALVCLVAQRTDFPWRELPVALPGLVVWTCPAWVVAVLLSRPQTHAGPPLAVALGLLLVLSILALALLPPPLQRLPLVVGWQSLYLLLASGVILQAARNDARLPGSAKHPNNPVGCVK